MTPRLALEVWLVLEVWPTPWSAGAPPVAPPPLTRFLAAATGRLDRKRPLQDSQACHRLLAPRLQGDRPVTCRHFLIAAPALIGVTSKTDPKIAGSSTKVLFNGEVAP